MKINEIYYGFKLLNIRETVTPKAVIYEFIHDKSGAPLYFLERDDENKSFSIGFNTPAYDDSGVFHILEHATLCGSRKFPVKEPFVELLKSSLYTFLNAMTYPDRTIYPVSSVNDRDFLNLIDIYMDAVLHPLALEDKRIFFQEGWHYEPVTDGDEKVTGVSYNGVVFNEMKGAYSDPDNVNYMAACRALFPDTTYSKDSGGTPEGIPSLTFDAFKAAHEAYYHPSNSCIILDGAVKLDQVLPLLDSYLKDYDRATPPPSATAQPDIPDTTVRISTLASEGEELRNKGKVLVALRSPDSSDREAGLAVSLLAEVLTGTNDSPLKKPLISSGLCGDVGFFTESSNLEDMYIIELRDVKDGCEDQLLKLLYETLEKIIKKGISKTKLMSALSFTEFKYKESDMGYSPAGLVYATVIYSAVFYKRDPVLALDLTDVFNSLRQRITSEPGYFMEVLEKFITHNQRKAVIISTPSLTVAEETAKEEEKATRSAYEKMCKEGMLDDCVRDYEDFHLWQQRENTPDALATIPKLTLDDLTPPPTVATNVYDVSGVKVISHPLSTSGILYLDLIFDLSDLKGEELTLLSFLSHVLPELPTERYTPEELTDRIRLYLGGFHTTLTTTQAATPKPIMKVTVSSLERNRSMMARITEDILTNGKYTDKETLKPLLQQTVSRQREVLSTEGLVSAIHASSAPFSEGAVISDYTTGISGYKILKSHLDSFDADGDALLEKLSALVKKVFTKSRLTLSVTGSYDKKFVKRMFANLPEGEGNPTPITREKPKRENKGIILPSRVSYAATSGKLHTKDAHGNTDKIIMNGGIAIARSIIKLIYLWDEVRVKGGAYGASLAINRFGVFTFSSYRDPSPKKSVETYRKAPEFLRKFAEEKRDITEHIIGTAGKIYTPASPRQTGEGATAEYLSNITPEYKRALYDSIISVTYDDIIAAADLLEKGLSDTVTAISGGKSDLDASADILDTVIEF